VIGETMEWVGNPIKDSPPVILLQGHLGLWVQQWISGCYKTLCDFVQGNSTVGG
jgi:hypothetical protein